MTKNYKKLLFAVLLCLPLLSFGQKGYINQDGTDRGRTIPLDMYNTDNYYYRSQWLLYESELNFSEPKVIHGFEFYYPGANDKVVDGLKIRVKLKNVGDFNCFEESEWYNTDDADVVYYAGVSVKDEIVSIHFNMGYRYSGGNLLVEFENMTKGSGLYLGNSTGWLGYNDGLVEGHTTYPYAQSASSSSFPVTTTPQPSSFTPKMWIMSESIDQFWFYYRNIGFEGNYNAEDWIANDNFGSNVWHIGKKASTRDGSQGSLYISSSNEENNYDNTKTTTTYAMHPLELIPNRNYGVHYDWRCQGEGNFDFMRVALAPYNYSNNPYSGWTTSSLPIGFTSLDGYNRLSGQSNWQHFSSSFQTGDNAYYRLMLFWHNDNNGGSNPPAAIDNIRINPIQTLPFYEDFEDFYDYSYGSFEWGDMWDYNTSGYNSWWIDSYNSESGDCIGVYPFMTNDPLDGEECGSAMFTLFDLEAGDYDVSFIWKGYECSRRTVRVAFIPAETGSFSMSSLPPGAIPADGGQQPTDGTWKTISNTVHIPTSGHYYLILMWYNIETDDDVSPVYIDNISVRRSSNSIEQTDGSDVTLFPNPATDLTTLTVSGITGETTLEITDLNGRIVRTETLQLTGNDQIEISTSDLAAGTYFVRVASHRTKLIVD